MKATFMLFEAKVNLFGHEVLSLSNQLTTSRATCFLTSPSKMELQSLLRLGAQLPFLKPIISWFPNAQLHKKM